MTVLCFDSARISESGLKLAILDSEKQRVDAALSAVNFNIEHLMLTLIAPLIEKRDLLEQRRNELAQSMAPLLQQVSDRIYTN